MEITDLIELVRAIDLGTYDNVALIAAERYLKIGCAKRALLALQQLSAPNDRQPGVLFLRWHLNLKMGDWESCLKTSMELVEVISDDVDAWLDYAKSLEKTAGGPPAALTVIRNTLIRFPENWRVHYRAACIASRTGDVEFADEMIWRTDQLYQLSHAQRNVPELSNWNRFRNKCGGNVFGEGKLD